MKTEIILKLKNNMKWYSWIEHCDRCGNLIHGHELSTNKRPKNDECDFCIDCLRYLMDHDISYSEAIKMYTVGHKVSYNQAIGED